MLTVTDRQHQPYTNVLFISDVPGKLIDMRSPRLVIRMAKRRVNSSIFNVEHIRLLFVRPWMRVLRQTALKNRRSGRRQECDTARNILPVKLYQRSASCLKNLSNLHSGKNKHNSFLNSMRQRHKIVSIQLKFTF